MQDMFLHWPSSIDIKITSEGKHRVIFSDDCPLEIQFHNFSFNHRLTPSYHDFLEITYIYTGEGTFYIENKKFEAHRGDIFVIGNTEFHRLEAHSGQLLKTIGLYFLPHFVYSIGQNSYDFEYLRPFYDHSTEFVNRIPVKECNSDSVLELIGKIYSEKVDLGDFYQLAVKNYLEKILLLVIRHFKRFSSDIIAYTNKRRDIERLKNVFSFLQQKYHEKLTLSSIANVACMSPSYLCKFFKRVTGSTLTDYVFRLRIDRAKELLLKGELSITEIAYETGFASHSYFDRIFKRLTNLSPYEYKYKLTIHRAHSFS